MPNNLHIIVKCAIGSIPRPLPLGMFEPMSRVKVQLSNGEEHTLFEFYPDEISFDESEFIGLTLDLAKRLKFQKEISFLRSQKIFNHY